MVATLRIASFALALFKTGSVLSQEHGEDAEKEMGPVAFMWPPDREWGAAQDNTPPCGSASGVTNRTQFPLMNGQVALVAQDESWAIQIAISHTNNPTSNDDFETLVASTRIPELSEGHQCYPITNPASDVEAGSNATLQIKYTSDFDTDKNETFYACADITYVLTSQFTYQVPCFNATIDDFNLPDAPNASNSSSSTAAGNARTGSSSATAQAAASSGNLSGGAIAGIVIGAIIGVSLTLGALFIAWRKSQQLKRLRQQEASLRKVKWDEAAVGSASLDSTQDIALTRIARGN